MFSLPEHCKILRLLDTAAGNAVTSDVVCMKNYLKAWFIVSHKGTNDTDLVLGLTEATDVAAGTSAAVTATFPIWYDTDHGTSSDTLVRATDAASYTIDPAATSQNALVVFEWDPVKHTSGYDCIKVTSTGGNASNSVSVYAILLARFAEDTPPSAIID